MKKVHGNTTHGASKTAEYRSWSHMIGRCYCPTDRKFKYYGARGIKVHPRWRFNFEFFLKDMGKKPKGMTLERRDNDGDYEPSNCQWATLTAQARNRRFNRKLTAHGRTQLMCDWAREIGVSESCVHYALKRGETLETLIQRHAA